MAKRRTSLIPPFASCFTSFDVTTSKENLHALDSGTGSPRSNNCRSTNRLLLRHSCAQPKGGGRTPLIDLRGTMGPGTPFGSADTSDMNITAPVHGATLTVMVTVSQHCQLTSSWCWKKKKKKATRKPVSLSDVATSWRGLRVG